MFVVCYFGDGVYVDGYVDSLEEGKEYVEKEVNKVFEGEGKVEWRENEFDSNEWIGNVFEGEYEREESYLIVKVKRLSV